MVVELVRFTCDRIHETAKGTISREGPRYHVYQSVDSEVEAERGLGDEGL